MSLISSSTEFILANTNIRPGTIRLPSTFETIGRIVTIKDLSGGWGRSTLTLAVNNPNQTFEDNSFSTPLTTAGGWTTLISGDNNKWYTIGGTQLNTVQTSTIQSSQINIANLSTGLMTMSTLVLSDQRSASTNSLFTASTLLYYNIPGLQSSILAGTRQASGFNLLRMRSPFQPSQIAGLNLWLDAADVNTLSIQSGNVVSWRDKSPSNTLARAAALGAAGLPRYDTSLRSVIFNGSGYFSNTTLSYTLSSRSVFMVCSQTTSSTTGFEGFLVFVNPTSANLDYDNQNAVVYTGRGVNVQQNCSYSVYYFQTGNPPTNTGDYVINYLTSTTPSPLAIYADMYASQSGTLFVNGTSVGTDTSVTIPGTSTGYILGARKPGTSTTPTNPLFGNIYEIITYPSLLNPTQRQQVEGYLAWKWNLVASLPPNHLYKNFPP